MTRTPIARSRITGQLTPTSPSAMPHSDASRSFATSSEPARSALVGMQPRLTQVPPSGPVSTSATRAPTLVAAFRALMPAAPPPITSRS